MVSRWSVLGRDRERAELDHAWSAAAAGAGGLVMLDGDAGVGKTALARVWLKVSERPRPRRCG